MPFFASYQLIFRRAHLQPNKVLLTYSALLVLKWGEGFKLNSDEEKILTYLRNNHGNPHTAFQITKNTDSGGNVALVKNALENLVAEGHVAKQVSKQGVLELVFYSVK